MQNLKLLILQPKSCKNRFEIENIDLKPKSMKKEI